MARFFVKVPSPEGARGLIEEGGSSRRAWATALPVGTLAAALLMLGSFATIVAAQPPAGGRSASTPRVAVTPLEGLSHPSVTVTSLNNAGVVAGCRFTGDVTAPFIWTARGGVQFFLGDTPGCATGINERGTVIGFLDDGDLLPAFLWSRSEGLIDLGTFRPAAINNRGQMAGSCVDVLMQGPCLWEDGHVTLLFTPGPGFHGSASDINEAGEITGQVPANGTLSAFVWSRRTGLRLLPSSSGNSGALTFGAAINNNGQVVGFETADGMQVPVHWTRTGVASSLPLPVGSAADINESGTWTGRYVVFVGGRNEWVGFAAGRHGVTSLGFGIPVAVNARGDILGTITVAGITTAVLWRTVP